MRNNNYSFDGGKRTGNVLKFREGHLILLQVVQIKTLNHIMPIIFLKKTPDLNMAYSSKTDCKTWINIFKRMLQTDILSSFSIKATRYGIYSCAGNYWLKWIMKVIVIFWNHSKNMTENKLGLGNYETLKFILLRYRNVTMIFLCLWKTE